MKTGLLSKIVLASILGLSAPSAAGEPMKVNLPDPRPDDGRPSMAKVYDNDRNWYLSVPVIPNMNMNDLSMTWNGWGLYKHISSMDLPEGDDFTVDNVNKFIDDLKNIPVVNGNLNLNGSLRFGIMSKYIEIHAAGGAEGRADFKFRNLTGEQKIDYFQQKLILEPDQTIFEGAAYGDMYGKGRLVVPVQISDFILKSYVTGGYRYREGAQGHFYLPRELKSTDDIISTEIGSIRTTGQGFFFDAGFVADMSKIPEIDFLRPVIAFSVENIYSQMKYTRNPLQLPEHDPVRYNAGLQISPCGILNLRADFINIKDIPEIRLEVERAFGPLEMAVFGRLYEKNLFNENRHSVNLYLGLTGDIANFGLYGSYDSFGHFGAGAALSLGWHPEMK